MTIRRDPFEMMDRMFEQMRRTAMDDPAGFPMAADHWADEPAGFGGGANLRTEKTEDGYLVMADLPGFEKEDIAVRFEDGLLTISAESEATEEADDAFSRRSRRVSDRLEIPGSVRVEDVEASYRNGVLEIAVPVAEDVADDGHVIDVQ